MQTNVFFSKERATVTPNNTIQYETKYLCYKMSINVSLVLVFRVRLKCQHPLLGSKWPIFPAARFLLVSAAINEGLGGSSEPGVRAATKQE